MTAEAVSPVRTLRFAVMNLEGDSITGYRGKCGLALSHLGFSIVLSYCPLE